MSKSNDQDEPMRLLSLDELFAVDRKQKIRRTIADGGPNLDEGAYPNLSFQLYLQLNAVSKHDLDEVSRSPAHLVWSKQHPQKVTPAMNLGSAAHAWILEPGKASEQVMVMPHDINRRTKAGKAEYEDAIYRAGDRVVVTASEVIALDGMAEAVHKNKAAHELLSQGQAETSLLWKDTETGLMCRGRPDWYREDGIVVDLKTCQDARRDPFSKSAATYRYHVQAAYYLWGLSSLGLIPEDTSSFVFICIEKTPPYGVAVYSLDTEDIERGAREFRADLNRYAEVQNQIAAGDVDKCPSYPETILSLSLPGWARNQIDAKYPHE